MKNSLRIFSLNTEYGKYSKTLIPYIASIASDFDVFCFQEVPKNSINTICFEKGYEPCLYDIISKTLSDFEGYYCEYVKDSFGIATFVKKGLKQKYNGESYIFGSNDKPFIDKKRWNNSTKCLSIKVNGIYIINLHGAWQPKSKKQDTPERILQSKILRKISKGKEHKTILIGDFNLMPDTKSIKILEKKYTNLIKKYSIKSTRTSVYDDPSLPFADYALVGEDLEVIDFQVKLEPIFSDHGFMMLTLNI